MHLEFCDFKLNLPFQQIWGTTFTDTGEDAQHLCYNYDIYLALGYNIISAIPYAQKGATK